MAWLSAYLPADQAAGIWNGITASARALQGPTEARTLTQLRADVAAKLLLSAGFTTSSPMDGSTEAAADSRTGLATTRTSTSTSTSPSPSTDGVAGGIPVSDGLDRVVPGLVPGLDGVDVGRVPSPAAQVLVTVPVFALMGLTDEPADLDGYGPIPASMARKLVADGASSFRRVLIDPRDGAPTEIGRESYRIPAAMRQWLRLRDGRCSFPGCNNQSLDNEADHILAWADGGTTGISNLESLCRKHHRLKHSTAWTPSAASVDEPPGWTSPTGRHYQTEHQDWEPPHWPAQILDQLSRREVGSVVPEHILPGQPPPEELLQEDPLPEWVRMQWPIDEPDPDPRECPPYDDSSLPEDPFPDWACSQTSDSAIR